MLTITLYTKDDCGLCDEVKAQLADLVEVFPHALQEVDITKDTDLYSRYRFSIPVVKIGNETLKAPITANQLIATLQNESKK